MLLLLVTLMGYASHESLQSSEGFFQTFRQLIESAAQLLELCTGKTKQTSETENVQGVVSIVIQVLKPKHMPSLWSSAA